MRLNKFLARAGIGSRRKCDIFISEGLIKINGKIIKDFSYQVSDNDYIQFENKYIEVEPYSYFILNKPKGYVCSNNDDLSRKIIFDLIPFKNKLFSIGRLDYDTTGIILITNNGDFCNSLAHPKFNIVKKYYVLTNQKLSSLEIKEIKKGIKVDNTIMRGDFKVIDKNKSHFLWEVILTEGKNKEIKRIFKNYDINVLKLHRYEFAGIQLGNLKEGKTRKLKKREISSLITLINEKK